MTRSEKYPVVAVLPNGVEWHAEIDGRYKGDFEFHQVCSRAVAKQNMTTSRKNPESWSVGLFKLTIKDGQLVRSKIGTYEIQLPLAPMTVGEYNAELDELLEQIPTEFHGFVSSSAYERGHSAGYEEVLGIARTLVSDLLEPIKKFKQNLTA